MAEPYPSEFDEFPSCSMCGKDPAACDCPICPKCFEQGNPACYDAEMCGGLIGKRFKTRKVNVIAFESDRWLVALNLPEVPLNVQVMTPQEGKRLAAVLRRDVTAVSQGHKLRELAAYAWRNIAADLLPEVARQLENMSSMAESTQMMADMSASPSNRSVNPAESYAGTPNYLQ